MAESPQHKERVAGLVDWMRRQGANVTHAAGGQALPDPYAVGRHEPDALAMKDGVLWIGEAKVGTDLGAETSREQLKDFSQRQMTQSRKPCPFILCVPKGYDGHARQAVLAAGGSRADLTVIA